jgi:hypothetical protein
VCVSVFVRARSYRIVLADAIVVVAVVVGKQDAKKVRRGCSDTFR